MKIFKKILKFFVITVFSIALLAGLADAAWVFLPRLLSARKIAEVDSVAKKVEDLTVPESAKVIALGEATHGNKEFQELRLEVLKHLIQSTKVRSFALEADWGEGMTINNYIHGGKGNATDIVKDIAFSIYRTKEMADLIEWMREYNETAPESEKLNFYGFDMQNPDKDLKFITEFCKRSKILTDVDLEKSLLPITPENSDKILELLGKISDAMTEEYNIIGEQRKTAPYLQAVNVFGQSVEYYKAISKSPIESSTVRDKYMAENVQWIQEYEEGLGHSQVFISGHNGHIAFSMSTYANMGHNLHEHYNSAYFAIGTDFYNTSVNVPDFENNGIRTIANFCSADTLAYQAKYHDNKYLLQFSNVDEKNKKVNSLINSPLNMGSLGEEYYFFMKLLPITYIEHETPAKLYDAMIFLYETTPIEILE